jgi:hypothetical protein
VARGRFVCHIRAQGGGTQGDSSLVFPRVFLSWCKPQPISLSQEMGYNNNTHVAWGRFVCHIQNQVAANQTVPGLR